MTTFDLRYRVSEAEFNAAIEEHFARTGISSRFNLIVGGLGVCGGVAYSVLFEGWVGLFLLAVSCALLGIILLRNHLWRRSYRSANTALGSDIHSVFDDQAILVERTSGSSKLTWQFFKSYLETPDATLLYPQGKLMFSIIPNRAFASGDDLQAFRTLLGQKLSEIGAKRNARAGSS